jgi:hypothetical protein
MLSFLLSGVLNPLAQRKTAGLLAPAVLEGSVVCLLYARASRPPETGNQK